MAKRGRPPKGNYAGNSAVLTIRMQPDLRQKLEAVAAGTGKSLSQEIQFRLKNSFADEQKQDDRFGGPKLHAVFRAMAEIAKEVGPTAYFLKNMEPAEGNEWLADPYAFEQVVAGCMKFFAFLRPPGDSTPPAQKPLITVHISDDPDFPKFEWNEEDERARNALVGEGIAQGLIDLVNVARMGKREDFHNEHLENKVQIARSLASKLWPNSEKPKRKKGR